MKKLILVRHGKSSWEHNVRDHDRPLNKRGINDGHLMAEKIKDLGLHPEVVWSSSATRALSTAVVLTEKIDYSLRILKIDRALYTFNYIEQLEVVKSCDDHIDTLMIVSHNHGLTQLASYLGSSYLENVPTTGVVVIEFQTSSWQDIEKGQTIMELSPKQLK